MSIYVKAIMYDGIARGRYRAISKKFFPLNWYLLINQAGITPNNNARVDVIKIR